MHVYHTINTSVIARAGEVGPAVSQLHSESSPSGLQVSTPAALPGSATTVEKKHTSWNHRLMNGRDTHTTGTAIVVEWLCDCNSGGVAGVQTSCVFNRGRPLLIIGDCFTDAVRLVGARVGVDTVLDSDLWSIGEAIEAAIGLAPLRMLPGVSGWWPSREDSSSIASR